MKFFDKTLDEIYDILSDVNDQIFVQTCEENEFPKVEVTFEFSDWYGVFKLDNQELFSTENNDQQFFEETNEYENIKVALINAINERLSAYTKIKIVK